MKPILVISPSGNLYGSEQVLMDYLANTTLQCTVEVPKDSVLFSKLISSRHRVHAFANVWGLYARVFLALLTGEYDTVYLNEAGHIRYIQKLAAIFRSTRFVVHVRIAEDAATDRWKNMRENIVPVTISDYMRELMDHDASIVYDLYDFPDTLPGMAEHTNPTKVALIGRITYTKGFREFVAMVTEMEGRGILDDYQFNLYGDLISDVIQDPGLAYLQGKSSVSFRGFVEKDQIYAENEIVLHLSKTEPLGRIFFESIAYGRPFLGFLSGGIGEIGRKTGLERFLLRVGDGEIDALVNKLEELSNGKLYVPGELDQALVRMKQVYGVDQYTKNMDKILAGK